MSWMSPLTVPMTILPIGSHAGLGQQRPEDFHPALHGIRREQNLRHEQDAVAKVDADDAHAFDQRIVEHALGRPAARQEDVRRLLDLGLEAVVEVVVHLLGEFLVIERGQVEFVFSRL